MKAPDTMPVLEILHDIRAEINAMKFELSGELGSMRSELMETLASVRRGISSDFAASRAREAEEHQNIRHEISKPVAEFSGEMLAYQTGASKIGVVRR